jgi:hypothetical protein
MQASSFSWSWLRCSRSSCCCLAYSSRCRRSISEMLPSACVASPFSLGRDPGADPCNRQTRRSQHLLCGTNPRQNQGLGLSDTVMRLLQSVTHYR